MVEGFFRRLFGISTLVLALLLLAGCGGKLPDTGDAAITPSTQTQAPLQPDATQPEPTLTAPAQTETAPPETAPFDTAPSDTTLPTQEDDSSSEIVPSDINCSSPAALTPSMTEGPYYKPDSPERTSLLEEGIPGTQLILTGYVLTQDCQPVVHAWLDFWQADGNGEYDNAGYKLRGHQLTDQAGSYYLETVIPGLYPGRTEHIHVKVQAPGGPVLTTQLFFPGVPGNETDSIFSPQLLTTLQDTMGGKLATFNFILAVR